MGIEARAAGDNRGWEQTASRLGLAVDVRREVWSCDRGARRRPASRVRSLSCYQADKLCLAVVRERKGHGGKILCALKSPGVGQNPESQCTVAARVCSHLGPCLNGFKDSNQLPTFFFRPPRLKTNGDQWPLALPYHTLVLSCTHSAGHVLVFSGAAPRVASCSTPLGGERLPAGKCKSG